MQTRQCKCLLVAQILQTGLDHPNAIILHSMWARARLYIWARIKINVAQVWASSGLFYLFIFMAAMQPSYGLLVAKQERTAQVPSFFIVCGLEQGVGYGPELKTIWLKLGPVLFFFFFLVYSCPDSKNVWAKCG